MHIVEQWVDISRFDANGFQRFIIIVCLRHLTCFLRHLKFFLFFFVFDGEKKWHYHSYGLLNRWCCSSAYQIMINVNLRHSFPSSSPSRYKQWNNEYFRVFIQIQPENVEAVRWKLIKKCKTTDKENTQKMEGDRKRIWKRENKESFNWILMKLFLVRLDLNKAIRVMKWKFQTIREIAFFFIFDTLYIAKLNANNNQYFSLTLHTQNFPNDDFSISAKCNLIGNLNVTHLWTILGFIAGIRSN